eukprot:GEMP01048432.1.p1 GENE.GEMP01048432.1~~GEMP01048432.1.p1  ORF type:complete len:368 (+),score=63.28 GEMP01048432.1:163-1266(+)
MRRRRGSEDTGLTYEGSVFTKVKSLDAYSKVHSDHMVQTRAGGFISIMSFFLMMILFISQLQTYFTVEVMDHIVVDTTLNQKLPIGLDISFPNLRCDEISVDTVDSTGDNQVDVSGTLHKQMLDSNGLASTGVGSGCLSCLDAEAFMKQHGVECCNTCADLKEAYKMAEIPYEQVLQTARQCTSTQGCRVHGDVLVSKVAGNIHVAMGKSKIRDGRHVHEFNLQDVEDGFNTSHVIHRLDFGAEVPGVRPPLEGASKIVKRGAFMFHYYIKLVPTSYMTDDNPDARLYTHQYSVTDTSKNVLTVAHDLTGLPGVFFVYEFNPFLIQKIQNNIPFTHFLTSVCAIIGGIFAVAGVVDAFIFRTVKFSR